MGVSVRRVLGLVSHLHSGIMGDTFLYFGYGSNLLKERLQILNPSAQFVAIAKLPDYKLDFNYNSGRWKGAAATITEAPGDRLWGVVWRMKHEDLPNLDRQEGVENKIYRPLKVQVTTSGDDQLTCRTYQLLRLDSENPRPSPHYLDVLVRGAMQNSLPADYIEFLKNIETNGYQGEVTIYQEVLKSLEK